MAITGGLYRRRVALGTFAASRFQQDAALEEEHGERVLCVRCATHHDRTQGGNGKLIAVSALVVLIPTAYLVWNGSLAEAVAGRAGATAITVDARGKQADTGEKPIGGPMSGLAVQVKRGPRTGPVQDIGLEEATTRMANLAPKVTDVVAAQDAPAEAASAEAAKVAPAVPPQPVTAAAPKTGTPWPNHTAAGTRWELRHRDDRSAMLRLDLGFGQVASLIVPLDYASDTDMLDGKIDQLRTLIRQRFPLQSALFMHWRDGKVRLIQAGDGLS